MRIEIGHDRKIVRFRRGDCKSEKEAVRDE